MEDKMNHIHKCKGCNLYDINLPIVHWEYPKEDNIISEVIVISDFEKSEREANLLEDKLGYINQEEIKWKEDVISIKHGDVGKITDYNYLKIKFYCIYMPRKILRKFSRAIIESTV